MKKIRKIIVVALVVLLVGFPVLFFIQRKNTENKEHALIKEVYSLSDFSVVVGMPGTRFEISSGIENKLIVKYPGEKVATSKPYEIKKDTLFITEKFNPLHHDKLLQIQGKNINTLILNQTEQVFVTNFRGDSLKVFNNDGKVLFGLPPFEHNRNKILLNIKNFHYSANKGSLILENIIVENSIIKLTQSKLSINNNVNIKSLELNAADSSEVTKYAYKKGNIQNIQLQVDSNSICALYKR